MEAFHDQCADELSRYVCLRVTAGESSSFLARMGVRSYPTEVIEYNGVRWPAHVGFHSNLPAYKERLVFESERALSFTP